MPGILFEVTHQIGKITLNRPEVFNSFNREMALEMQHHLNICDNDPEIRCVVITGAGKAFCAGQDLKEVTDPDGPELRSIVGEHYNPIIKLIRYIEKPVIAGVNGVAAGAGANIALACDIVIAAESASFIQAFSKIGLIPDSGGTFTLPRLIGWQKASALMMLGDKINALEAERMGMIYQYFPDDQFQNALDHLSTKVSQMPTRGLALTKKALNASLENNLIDQLGLEEEYQTMAGETYDYQEGVAAFLEKRMPEFKGE